MPVDNIWLIGTSYYTKYRPSRPLTLSLPVPLFFSLLLSQPTPSLSFSLSLCPSLSLSPSLSHSGPLSLYLSFPLSFSLSTCPPLSHYLRPPLTLPLSLSLSPSLSPCPSLSFPFSFSFSPCPCISLSLPASSLHLSLAAGFSQTTSPGRYLHIKRPGYTSGTAFIVHPLHVQAARAITRPDRHLSTAIKPASSQFSTFHT